MKLNQLFSVITGVIGITALAGSWALPLRSAQSVVGSGAMPLLCSLTLIVLSVLFFFVGDEDGVKINFSNLIKPPARDGLVFYLLNFVLFALIYMIGTAFGMVIFGIITQLMIKKQSFLKSLIFNIVWVAVLYVVFDRLLYVQFEKGIFFN